LLGPISGVVMTGTLLDIGTAWGCLLVGGLGPIVGLGTAALLRKIKIDDPKVVPLALGPGIVGALLTGFLEWGTRTGGYIGLEGKYAVGVGEITPWWQLAGIVTTMLIAGVPALVMCLVFEKFGGLRVPEEAELVGMDITQWGVSNFDDDLVPADPRAAPASSAAAGRSTAAIPATEPV
ncbi:MAG: ammonium transporter, partial [Modestobacter sp.]|nr:ammonium transporter [Modestobacter sp.]